VARFLCTWELGLRYGHVAQLAPVAAALSARGHSVSLAARDVIIGHEIGGSTFARILQAPVYRGPGQGGRAVTYAALAADGGLANAPAAEALTRSWLALFEALAPDAIIAEHAPVSLLAAHVAGLPAVRIGSGFTVPPATRPLPALLGRSGTDAERLEGDAAADRVVRHVVARLGGAFLDGLAELLARSAPFLTTWPELDHYGARRGATYYGPLRMAGGPARPEWPQGQGPRVFVYLPSAHESARPLAAALGEMGWPVLWHAQDGPPESLARNISFSAEPLDVAHLLPGVRLLACRGSHGLCAAALRHGTRCLLLPDSLETQLASLRLARGGFGVIPAPGRLEAMRAGLDQLLRDEVIARATSAARARYRRYDEDVAAARLARDIESCVSRDPTG
jgi:UDP:flavonoid glycosyltransferase YjiC (YdhE family)